MIDSKTYQGRKVKLVGKPSAKPEKLVENILSALDTRFQKTPVVQATSIVSLSNWPKKGSDNIPGLML